MNRNQTTLQVSLVGVMVTVISLLFWQRLAGQFMAWQETQHLRSVEATSQHINLLSQWRRRSGATAMLLKPPSRALP